MNDNAPIAEAVPGHNNPPSDAEILRDRLLQNSKDLIARHAELIAGADRIPEKCDNDETAGKLADMIKLITACKKAMEGKRVAEKEPFLTLQRAVDGFFKRFTDTLDTAKDKVNRPLSIYLNWKEEENRRLAREQAQRDEEAARAKREEAAQQARDAEAQEAAAMPSVATQTFKEAVSTEKQASRMDKVAERSARKAEASPAAMSRTRGDMGSVASLKKTWVGTITDESQIDWNLLREFIPAPAKAQAVQAWARTKQTELAGAYIREELEAAVR